MIAASLAKGSMAALLALLLGAWFQIQADPASAATRAEVRRLIVEEALASRVPPSLAMAVAKIESDFQETALSPAGARGVMQIMPQTGQSEFGVDADELWDPRLNIEIGVGYLEQLLDRYGGRWDLALSHYYSGRVSGRMPAAEPHPVAHKYVASVLRWERRYAEQSDIWAHLAEAPPRVPVRPAATPRVTAPALAVVAARPAADPKPSGPRVIPAGDETGLHDFDGTIEERRLRMRSTLDDFTPAVRWHDG